MNTGWQYIWPIKKPIPVIPKGYIPKQVEEEKPERNQLT